MKGHELATSGPHLPARWSYTASVRRMKATVWKWKRLTASMLHELWTAHAILTHPGARTDLDANATRSWDDYCDAIGLNRTTAWRWLRQYDPVGRQLIETEPRAERTALVLRSSKPADPDELLMREIRPRLEKMNLMHRLRVAARIVAGR